MLLERGFSCPNTSSATTSPTPAARAHSPHLEAIRRAAAVLGVFIYRQRGPTSAMPGPPAGHHGRAQRRIRAYPLPQRGLRFTLGPSKLPAGVTLGGVASHWQNTEDFSAENEDAEMKTMINFSPATPL